MFVKRSSNLQENVIISIVNLHTGLLKEFDFMSSSIRNTPESPEGLRSNSIEDVQQKQPI